MIGTRVGIYEIVEEIGRGGMATVYRAYQPNVDRFVAVKVIHARIAADPQASERFQREARLVARLEHPHLLPVYDYDGKHDPPYIVMRYLESGTLKDVLDEDVLPLSEIAFMVRQITLALDYAHRQGVIHRDIKPSNVMVDQDGNAFLTDFGIARFSESGSEMTGITQTGFAVGTPGYMAPEQGLGENIDHTADIYALGVMLFQMATGTMPYSAETPMAVVLKHIQDPIPAATALNPNLPPEFDDIIERAMAKTRTERYQSGSELSEAITRLAGAEALSKTPINLQSAAKLVIDKLHIERDLNKDSIDQTMATFAAQRSAMEDSDTDVVVALDAATVKGTNIEPTRPDGIPVARGRGGILVALAAIVIIAGIGLLLLSSGGGEELIDEHATGTRLAEIAAQTTDTRTPTATDTARPSNTPTNTRNPTETNSPPTPATPVIEARRDLVIRLGPGARFPEVGTFEEGDELEIVGVNEEGSWFEVLLPDGTTGWVLAAQSFGRFSGDRDVVQVVVAPSDTATFTPTATNTATRTPTMTNTPSNTPTRTPPPSDTPTVEPSDTPTRTPSPTDTATSTHTPTATNTPTLTPPPSDTPIPATETPTPLPSPTPIPAGRLPFIADFEDADPIDGWELDNEAWQVVNEGGQTVLIAQANIDQPAIILGRERPEWLDDTAADFVVSFDLNLNANAGGARLVFRYDGDVGYNVLEVFPGALYLRRSQQSVNPFSRETERVIGSNTRVPITPDEWNRLTVWVEGRRMFVYLNRELVLQDEDLEIPQLNSGQIFLQAIQRFGPVRFDNVIVQRAEPYSDHFEGAGIPSTWRTTDTTISGVETESNGNQYLFMQDGVELAPIMSPIKNFSLACRIWSVQGGYTIDMRETDSGGSLQLEATGGHFYVRYLDSSDAVVFERFIQNVYGRGGWQGLSILLEDNRFEVYLDGRSVFEDTLAETPGSGNIVFRTQRGDVTRIDDCLVTQAATALNEGAAFAYELVEQVGQRPVNSYRSDYIEDFTDSFMWRDRWIDRQDAPGEFTSDPSAETNQNFLRIIHDGGPVYRIMSTNVGIAMFGDGRDSRNFSDATDLVTNVEVRFPDGTPGEAWMATRVNLTITGTYVEGYFLRVRRNVDGSTDFIVTYEHPSEEVIFFEGPIPGAENEPLPEWIPLSIVTYRDQIAFFANGRFLLALDNAIKLGGSVALGVEDNTTADFDTFSARDTTPHGQ